jgi:tRNA-2-methylthio-N6-dimethylallyladenosine synthase
VSRTYFIETFGCQMNVHDSERMAGLLEASGYEHAPEARDADVIVINTCSVREHAEEKLYTRLGELRQLRDAAGRRPLVAVAGCVAQQEGAALLRRTNGHVIDLVVGTQRQRFLPALLEQAAASAFPGVAVERWDDVTFPIGVARRGDAVRAYVTIIEGCNEHCSFCVVPYTRGHERMRPKAEILDEVRDAVASGRKEIHLLGQIVNHYRAPDDPRCDFAGLLAAVHDVRGVVRVRFASPHPRHTTPALLEAVRDLPRVCKHLHLPVQSGSTRVLAAMRRRYTREQYLELLDRARVEIPGVTITTDLIVGFPGETADDFDQTLALLAAARYQSVFAFKYSPRPNTLASRRFHDPVPPAEKTARIVALQALQRAIQQELHEALVGAPITVLVEATSRRRRTELSGRSTGNTVVNFPVPADTPPSEDAAAWIGREVRVRVERAGPHSVWGRIIPGGRSPGGHAYAD